MATEMQLTKRQREVKQEWFDHTGFEFMGPDDEQSFNDALRWNRQWLIDHAAEAQRIGEDLINKETFG